MDRRRFLLTSAALLAGARAGALEATPWGADALGIARAPRPVGAAGPPFGLVVHQLDGWTLRQLAELRVGMVRYTVYWHHWPEREYRAEIARNLERASELDLLLVLHGFGDDLRDFNRFVREVHALAPRAAIQPWNEIDSRPPFPGAERFRNDPRRYVGHLQDLRSALPDVRLVSAGLSNDGDELRRWMAALAGAPIDRVGIHTYGLGLRDVWRGKARIAREFTDLPLWCTEVGLEKAVVPTNWPLPHDPMPWEEAQRYLVDEFSTVADCERAYIYVLRDDRPDGHSIVRPDGSHRPLAEWLKTRRS